MSVQDIARQAYIYAAPMIENYQTMGKQAVDRNDAAFVGGFGHVRNYAEPFTPQNHDVVTPNNDTPYSWAWLDLRAEPWVLSVPEVPADRYYVMQWFDLFTFNFAYVGSRATGNSAGNYLFVGPGWQGDVPPGIASVFHAETQIVGMLGRTAADRPGEEGKMRAIQAGYRLLPLSSFVNGRPPPAAPPIDFPPFDEAAVQGHDFIRYLNFLLQFAVPPDPSEVALRESFATIGIGPGKPWDAAMIDAGTLAQIDAGIADAKRDMDAQAKTTLSSNGLFGTRAFLKNNYLVRAIAARKGMYGNSQEEAWYGGMIGDGHTLSRLHFSRAELPQARFFWSATLYTLPDRFLYDNPLKRYSIGDRTEGLVYGADGSLDIYIGHASPGGNREANWLPAPAGPYSLVARVYGPGQALLDGNWHLPPLEPVS
jgi:hypothetical protein